ncbi:perforin-1 [Xenopus laevis]|uniref:Perforin-1 n=1 Tax=Xenopus laevis TaxID=8355 RepID=A0A8J0U630_XENLA|nr:perforin-1 [Xenopus laevis]OCT59068.1 hypothetical protein XELAEV_18001556mg [Xenopus laevis]
MFPLLLILLNLFTCGSSTSPPLTYDCRLAKGDECIKLTFIPGHSLLGMGFDIVTLKRTEAYVVDMHRFSGKNKKCMVCNNPHKNNARQKLPFAIADWRPYSSCSRKITSEVSRSSVSLAEDAASGVQNDWKAGLELQAPVGNAKLVLAGSQSQLAKFTESKTNRDRYSFLRHQLKCFYYSFRLIYNPPLSKDFQRELKDLPKIYDTSTQEKFYRFIRVYGTHYISQAEVGGQVSEVTAIKTCQSTMDGLSLDELKDCLSMEASASVTGKMEANAEAKTCKEMSQKATHGESFHKTFNERDWQISGGKVTFDLLSFDVSKDGNTAAFGEWMESLKTHPDIVTYSLESIHNLVRFKGPQKEHLRKAISDFIMEKALRKNCSCPGNSHPSHGAECSCVCSQSPDTNTNCCPTKRGFAKLVVTINQASGLWGDYGSKTDAYVKVMFRSTETVTTTMWNNDNPVWNQRFDLGVVELSPGAELKIEVWDEDNKYDDDRIGFCKISLTSELNKQICYCDHGRLDYTLKLACLPHLSGPFCHDYAPSKE